MEPSTALARVLVDELVRSGVREAVLAPGSRSAPLALALHAADAAGLLRLHVRTDERSAAFLALGLARGGAGPVPVVTTSGTATAHLLAAALEASHSGVPLLLVTADRPAELRGSGANQTTEQADLYGAAVRLAVDLPAPEARAGAAASWRGLVARLLAAARGTLTGEPGPVHLNAAFREPLVPAASTPAGLDGATWPDPLQGRPSGAPWTEVVAPAAPAPPVDDLPERTVAVLGDAPPHQVADALRLAVARGFPVLAEPSATPAGEGDPGEAEVVVAGYDAVLGAPDWLVSHRPAHVLVVGRPTLSRAVGRLVAQHPVTAVRSPRGWSDPPQAAARVLPAVPAPGDRAAAPAAALAEARSGEREWLRAWRSAGTRAAAAVDAVLAAAPGLTEPGVARAVLAATPLDGLLLVGSSTPVRDLALVGPRPGPRVLANRGLAGIDGLVSTAAGAALAHQAAGGDPALALLGDLSLLHDAGGLAVPPGEPLPDLCVVVVDNRGGGIFGRLEQAAPEHAGAFERVFGTPHPADLAALATALGVPATTVDDPAGLAAALQDSVGRGRGLRVVVARTDRAAAADLDARLRAAARDAVEAD